MSEPNTPSLSETARRHGFSEAAVQALAEALARGGGAMAQFSHPELGGMGQYTRGGMLMIGAMGDDALKARVRALADDLAGGALPRGTERGETPADARPVASHDGDAGWWPAELGRPSASGAQNGMRYAVFPERKRLAVEREGRVTVHDTGEHRITGASQQQSGASSLRFSDADGAVDLEAMPTVP